MKMKTKVFKGLMVFGCFFFAFLASALDVKLKSGRYVLSNEYVRVLINPENGGRVEKFIDLKNKNSLTVAQSATIAPGGSGMCIDRFLGAHIGKGFSKVTYKAKSGKVGDNEVFVELDGVCKGLRILKRISLSNGVCGVKVAYQLTNVSDKNITGKLWVANIVYPNESPKKLSMFFPWGKYDDDFSSRGGTPERAVLSYSPGVKPLACNNVVNDPVADWCAVVDQNGVGAAIQIDYSNLDRFYSYQPPVGMGNLASIEWFTRRLLLRPLKAGIKDAVNHPELKDPLQDYVYKTSWEVMPLSGFKRVDGVSNGVTVALDRGESVANLKLSSMSAVTEAVVELSFKKLGGEYSMVGKNDGVTLKPGATVDLNIPLKGVAESGVFKVCVSVSGTKVCSMDIPHLKSSERTCYKPSAIARKDHRFDPKDSIAPFGTNFVDKCVKWAKPLKRKLKVLAIYSQKGHREIAELTRRVDLDLTPVELGNPHVFANPITSACFSWKVPNPNLVLAEALKKKYNVILIAGGVIWTIIPEKFRGEIVEKIKNGTGLVYITTHEKKLAEMLKIDKSPETAYLFSGVPFNSLPVVDRFKKPEEFIKTSRLGKGRVVLLKYNQLPNGKFWRVGPRMIVPNIYDDLDYNFHYWEYYFSLCARPLIYASREVPKVRVVSSKENVLHIINETRIPVAALVYFNAFDKFGELVSTRNMNLIFQPGENILEMPDFKACMNGELFVNVSLRSGGKVFDWYSFSNEIKAPLAISHLKLDKFAHSSGESVTGSCKLRGVKSGDKLALAVLDMYGRLLGTNQITLSKASAMKFNVELSAPSKSRLCRLKASLIRGETTFDRAEKFLTIHITESKDVKFLIWGTGFNSWTQKAKLANLKKMGFDWCTGLHVSSTTEKGLKSAARHVLEERMGFIPMSIQRVGVRVGALKIKKRVPCLRDPAFIKEVRGNVGRYAGYLRDYYPPYYCVGDENSLGDHGIAHDFCFGDYCLEKLRLWLKTKYVSVEALNTEWNTDFKKWSDVVPSTLCESTQSGHFASWADHRNFMFNALAEVFAVERDALRRVDPNGLLSISGMGSPNIYNGFDWAKMEKSLDLVSGYLRGSGRVMDPMRSFRRRGGELSRWIGYGVPIEKKRWQCWQLLFNGFNVVSYWYSEYLISHGDDSFSQEGKDIKELFGELRDSGIGKLLISSRRVPPRFGVLYSTPSLIATGVTATQGGANTLVYNSNWDCWSWLLRDCGFQAPRYFTPEQLTKDVLTPAATPCFLLPLSQALDDSTILALRKYVESGGVLLTDANAGIMKTNCNFRKSFPLADIFGIGLPAPKKMVRPEMKNISYAFSGGGKLLPLKSAAAGVVLTTSKAFGKTPCGGAKAFSFGGMKVESGDSAKSAPCFIMNKFGRGSAIYLNSRMLEYDDVRGKKSAELVRNAFMDILRKGGLDTELIPQLPGDSEFASYQLGKTRILCLLRGVFAGNINSTFRIKLPKTGFAYDVMAGKFLGSTKELAGSLAPGEAKVLTVLPEKIENLSLSAGKSDRGIAYKMKVNGGVGEIDTVVHLNVYGPDGVLRKCYAENILLKGTAHGVVPLALNEKRGAWRLDIMEINSGIKKSVTVKY